MTRFALALMVLVTTTALAAERVELKERDDGRVWRVQNSVSVTGTLKTATLDGKGQGLPLKVQAELGYYERRLEGLGRDAEALRNVRRYDKAGAVIQVADHVSKPVLRRDVTLIVGHGLREGIDFFSPSGPLLGDEVELLHTPIDSLGATALLPEKAVEQGDSWRPADWVLACLVGIEATEKSSLVCTADAITETEARVSFKGEIAGGIQGATADIKVFGTFVFDLKEQGITRIEFTQNEKRTMAVSPGLDVTAKATLVRSPSATTFGLAEKELGDLPLTPDAGSRLVMFESADWELRLLHERLWKLSFPGPPAAVFRLVEKGSLVAQVNLAPLPAARAGEHTSEMQFQGDIQRALKQDFRKILQAEEVPTKDGRYILRMTVVGETKREVAAPKTEEPKGKTEAKPATQTIATPIVWIYYLIAAPDGRQAVMVFAVDAELVETLAGRDLSVASGLEFLPRKKLVPKAEPK